MNHLARLLLPMIAITGDGVAADDRIAPTVDFTRPEPGEHLPGGATTHVRKPGRDAFSQASANMSPERRLDFTVGNGFFNRLWVTAPASTQGADGLGPLYNARSCQACHLNDGRGHPPDGPGDNAVSMVLRVSIPPQTDQQQRLLAENRVNNFPDPVYGSQLQDFAIAGHDAEYRLAVRYEEQPVTLADGTVIRLRRPRYATEDLGYGPLHPQARLSPRVAPQMTGLGLLEAIDERDILARADPDDADGDGISGRPNRAWDRTLARVVLGRFGHKAGEPGVDQQSQAAFAADIGISVPLHRHGWGECSEHQPACRNAPDGNTPRYGNLEAGSDVTGLVAFYARHLAVPARRDPGDREVLAGKRLFYQTGCIACHVPKYVTRGEGVDPEHAGQLIWPYTDLLLHDMGEGLADDHPEGVANGREWRTAPLWGIGLTPLVNGHENYLHDGRARGLLEAILWHGGEAQAQRDAVVAMSAQERQQLLRFIESL